MLVGVFISGSKIKKNGRLNLPIPRSDYVSDEEHLFCILASGRLFIMNPAIRIPTAHPPGAHAST
jgi:hypothetical protein